MECLTIHQSDDSVRNAGLHAVKPGKVKRACWHLPGSAPIRFLRFGFNMPGDPVYFGELHTGSGTVESASLLLVKRDGDPEILLFGFRSYEWSDGTFILGTAPDGSGFEVDAAADYDHYTLQPGESAGVDELLFMRGKDYGVLLKTWAEKVSEKMGRRIPDHIPTGWNDWQYYRNDKTQEDILENCDALKELKDQGWPLEYIQIDGGYCLHLSEWSQPKPEFSMGIPAVSEYIREAGFKFGLWFAPYIQNINTEVVRKHPDWLLRDPEGNPVKLGESNVGASVLIDYTVPGTLEWLKEKISMLVNEWHVEWIKLDGPNIAFYRRGVLKDPHSTVQQMLRKTLQVISESAGQALVEGEGSMTAALGTVALHRVQTDNKTSWYQENDLNRPYAPRVYGKELIMSFLHRIWWCNHRENIVLRDYPSPHCVPSGGNKAEQLFTANEQRVQLASAMIAPSGLLLTDPMAELIRRPELLETARMLFPPQNGRTEVVDPFPEDGAAYPHIFALDTGKKHFLAIINWGESTREFQLPGKYADRRYRSLFFDKERRGKVIVGARSAELLEELEERI